MESMRGGEEEEEEAAAAVVVEEEEEGGGGGGLGSRSWLVVPDARSKQGCDLLFASVSRFTPRKALKLRC